MKKIDVLYAVILPSRSDVKWSKNKVIGIKLDGGEVVTDESEIAIRFPAEGEIITFQTFSGKNETLLHANDLVEIPVRNIRPIESERQLVEVDHLPMVKRICFEVIEVPYELFSDNCFRMEDINSRFEGKSYRFGSTDIYISIVEKIFGPFKLLNGRIEPKIGKDVKVFKYDPESAMSYLGESFLIDRPKNEIGKADCMSSAQLMEWVKDKIKDFGQYNGEINNIIKLLRKTESFDNDLDRTRFSRALSTLENIELSIDDIANLFSEKSTWHRIFQEYFLKNESIFREKHLQNLEKEFAQISAQQSTKLTDIEKSLNIQVAKLSEKVAQNQELQSFIKQRSEELNVMDQKREELILGIRLQANITSGPVIPLIGKAEQPQTYEMRDIKNSSQNFFEILDDYLDELKGHLGFTAEKRRIFEYSLPVLFKKKFLLAGNINFTLALLQSLGDARICLQQAEIDWIKFGNMFPKGMEQIIEAAESDPELPHYFILQDFNLPSFECYGKPLIDLANGIREKIPGKDSMWPSNLSTILIPVAIKDTDLGFKINAETFSNWGILPFTSENSFITKTALSAKVDFEVFAESLDFSFQGDIEDYIN